MTHSSPSTTQLLWIHKQLHQHALQFLAKTLQHPWPANMIYARLHIIAQDIRQHLSFEEQFLMPIYQAHWPQNNGIGHPENFLKDHQLLKNSLEDLLDLSSETLLNNWPEDILRTPLLNLYDLFEHHDKREEEYFYPVVLENLLPEQAEIVQKQWQKELIGWASDDWLKQSEHIANYAKHLALQYCQHKQDLKNNKIFQPQTESLFDNKLLKLSQSAVDLPAGSIERMLKEKQLTRLWITALKSGKV